MESVEEPTVSIRIDTVKQAVMGANSVGQKFACHTLKRLTNRAVVPLQQKTDTGEGMVYAASA